MSTPRRPPGQGLFDVVDADAPLAERVRPRDLDDIVGQDHLLAADGALRRALAARRLPSLVLWGPPGTGKTTIARLLAGATGARFVALSAVMDGVARLREVVEQARGERSRGRTTLLFVDEIHRFHKGQQDALLPHVEDGTVVLVGATTEHPSFALTGALVSRAMVLVVRALAPEAIVDVLRRAIAHPRGLADAIDADDEALWALASAADGDARRALADLDALAAQLRSAPPPGAGDAGPTGDRDAAGRPHLDLAALARLQRQGGPRYDRHGTEHFHILSAFIKSLRASDPDAALYWLARMLEAGEDGRVICRRMVVFAAEDVSNADPRALPLAVATAQAHELTGLPESRIAMAHCATFLATAPKSAASYRGLAAAAEAVRRHGSQPVPLELRNPSTALGRQAGWGQGYVNPHDEGGFVAYSTLPEALRGATFYQPTANGAEAKIAERLALWRHLRQQAAGGSAAATDAATPDPASHDESAG